MTSSSLEKGNKVDWKAVKSALKFCFGDTERKIFSKHFTDIHSINERYVPPFKNFIQEHPPDGPQILFIRSAMGTGKSSRFLEYIENAPTAVIVSSRITYTQALCSKKEYGFENYQNVSRKIDFINHPRIIIQYQSLSRIKGIDDTENFARWDVLFLDEIDSLLKEALSCTMGKRTKSNTIKCFQKLVSSVTTVIVCDANLTEWHCDALLNKILMTPRKTNVLVINSNKGMFVDTPGLSVSVYTNYSLCPSQSKRFIRAVNNVSYKKKNEKGENLKRLVDLDRELSKRQDRQSLGYADHIFMSILSSWYCKDNSSNPLINSFITGDASRAMFKDIIIDKKSVVAVCNTKSLAYYICAFYIFYAGLKLDKDVVLLTGDSDIDHKRKITSCETMGDSLRNCRLFIYTSCIKVGVDISLKRFDTVYLFLSKIRKTSPLDLSDFYQMVGRIRRFNSLVIATNELSFSKKKEELRVVPSSLTYRKFEDKKNDDKDDYSRADDVLLYLTNKVSVERGIKRYPNTFFKCLLWMLINTTKKPVLSFVGKSYSDIFELYSHLTDNYRTDHVYECIITSYRKYADLISGFKDQLSRSIADKLSTKTQLFSFNAFKDFVNSSDNQRNTIEELCFMTTALSSLKGALAVCSEIDENTLEHYYKTFMPSSSLEFVADYTMMNNNDDVEDENSCFFDFRLEGETDKFFPPGHGSNRVKLFLYRIIKELCKNLDYSKFVNTLSDIKAAVKYKSLNKEIIENMYATFINEYIPDDFQYTLSVVKDVLIGECPSWIDVNKFLIFVSN